MAGDWLKVEIATPDKPEIWAIAEQLGIDPDAVFGKVFRIWGWFDQHSEDGNAPSVTKSLLDRRVGVTGFTDSMLLNGWLVEKDGVISMTNHEKHNGNSSKQRANNAKRQANFKKKQSVTDSNATGNAKPLLKALPKEEKRREDNIKDIVRFSDFWEQYPPDRRRDKKGCLKKWKDKKLDQSIDSILTDIKNRKTSHKDWLGGFIPLTTTYINQEQWDDGWQPVSHKPTTPQVSRMTGEGY